MEEVKIKEGLIRQLAECQKEKEEYLAGWKRAKADLINYKTEQEKFKRELGSFLISATLLEILKIKDSFEEALKNPPAGGPENLKNDEWMKGIKKIKDQFDQFLKNSGLEEIKSLGEKFNPEFHESIGEIESAKEEIILEEIQKGYKLLGRVLRPTKVKIGKKI